MKGRTKKQETNQELFWLYNQSDENIVGTWRKKGVAIKMKQFKNYCNNTGYLMNILVFDNVR